MNNENKTNIERSTTDSRQLISRLRALILDKKSISATDKDETERLVALCSVQFQKESSDDVAFELIAILNIAKNKGSKQAKTRTLNLSRWLNNTPPAIQTLQNPEEQLAAINCLNSIKFPWVGEYIKNSLKADTQTQSVSVALLQWGKKSAPSLEYFVNAIYTPFLGSLNEIETATKYLKVTNKLLSPYITAHPNEMAIALDHFSKTIVDLVESKNKNKKHEITLLGLAHATLTESWHQIPSMLLQPSFVSAYKKITSALSERKKIPSTTFIQIETATLNLISDCINRAPDESLKSLQLSRSLWESTFPNYSKLIKAASRDNPNLKAFIEYDPASSNHQPITSDLVEPIFAALLPAWQSLLNETSDKDSLGHLSGLIHRAAKCLNIEAFGSPGETVPFDPLWHTISNQILTTPNKVSILTPGVLVLRPDGTKRVLVPAFTAPA